MGHREEIDVIRSKDRRRYKSAETSHTQTFLWRVDVLLL